MVAAVCGGFLKPGPRYKAATPGVTVNGSVCSPLSCANGSGAVQNCGWGGGRDFEKAAMGCVSEFTISGFLVIPSLIQKPTIFSPDSGSRLNSGL